MLTFRNDFPREKYEAITNILHQEIGFLIAQFRYIKIQPKATDFSSKARILLCSIPQSLVLRYIVPGRI